MATRILVLGNGRRNLRYAVAAAALALAIAQPRGALGTKQKARHAGDAAPDQTAHTILGALVLQLPLAGVGDPAPDQRALVTQLLAALDGAHNTAAFVLQKTLALGVSPFAREFQELLAAEGGIAELSAARHSPRANRGRLYLRTKAQPDVVRIISVSDSFQKGPTAMLHKQRALNQSSLQEKCPRFGLAQLLIGAPHSTQGVQPPRGRTGVYQGPHRR
ncbi:MAG: hypothetical protein IPG96_20580 [Proteobacteria bacterium]|nr:hypothetical protein [Pseudomonadota bacterium]